MAMEEQIPKYPQYSDVVARIESFKNWTFISDASYKESLAESGMYSTGDGDLTRCFFCGGCFKNWLNTDDPWIEHAAWSPNCPFVRSMKDQNFISGSPSRCNKAFIDAFMLNNQDVPREVIDIALQFIRQHIKGTASKSDLLGVVVQHINALKHISSENGLPPEIELEDIEKEYIGTYKIKDIRHVVEVFVERYGFVPCLMLFGEEYEQMKGIAYVEEKNNDLEEKNNDLEDKNNALEKEMEALKKRMTCNICLDKEIEMVFLPCGHFAACADCSDTLQRGGNRSKCPICRKAVQKVIRAYMP